MFKPESRVSDIVTGRALTNAHGTFQEGLAEHEWREGGHWHPTAQENDVIRARDPATTPGYLLGTRGSGAAWGAMAALEPPPSLRL